MSEVAQALERGVQEDLVPAAKDAAQAVEDAVRSVAHGAEGVAGRTEATEADIAGKIAQVGSKDADSALSSAEADAARAGRSGAEGAGGDLSGAGAGDAVGGKGVGGCGKAGEPVDVVGGQMVTSRVDVELPGVLALVLRRAYASNYRHAGLFGSGFASTLDIRVQVGADEIVLADDDARLLSFAVPARPGQSVSSSAGPRMALSWDRERDVIRVLDRDNRYTLEFTALDATPASGGRQIRPLTSISHRCGSRVVVLRDQGLPLEVQHSAGYRVAVDTIDTPAGFRVEALRLLDGSAGGAGTRLLSYQYDLRGRLIAVTDASGAPFCHDWDDADRITAWTNRSGYQFRYHYDASGRVERTESDGGFLSGSFSYDPAQRVTVYTDSLGARTEHHYDAHGNVARIVDPTGNATVTEYDRHDQVVAVTDPLGATTRYSLDEHGNVARAERPDGTAASVEYDEHDEPVRVAGPDGAVWRFGYDQDGNLVEQTNPAGAVTSFGYGPSGRMTGVTDALGHATAIETNLAGLPVSYTDPLGATWRISRDARGRITAVTDPLGAVTSSVWDDRDLLLSRTLADGTVESWEYDADGALLRHIGAAGSVTAYERGPFQRIVARTDPDGARCAFTHDTELRLATVTNPQGAVWSYSYDPAGRLTGECDFNGRELSYAHDAAGRVALRVNGAGQSIAITRDPLGRVSERRTDDGQVTTYAYDAAGGLVRARDEAGELVISRDLLGRVTAETCRERTIASTYDAVGQRLTRTTPGGRVSVWQYDPAGRVQTLAADSAQFSFGYDAAGREAHRWFGPDLALTSTWDQVGRLTTRQVVGVEGPDDTRTARLVHEHGWTYRPDGVPLTVADTASGTRTMSLDAVGRVTAVSAEAWTEAYAYDAMGNLVDATDSRDPDTATSGPRTLTGTLVRSAGRTTYTYDAQSRLAKTVRRTLSGGQKVWTFAYDAYDRLTHAVTPDGTSWRYGYDPLGRRISKQRLDAEGLPVEEYRFTWDGAVLAEQVRVRAGEPVATAISWDYEPGGWTPLAQDRRSFLLEAPQEVIDRQFHAIVTDLVGTPTELVTADGRIAWTRTASIWGAPVAPGAAGPGGGDSGGDDLSIDCPLRFPGQYHDPETGLDYNYHRYYDPATARYTGPDLLGLSPALNHHAYTDNPLIGMDALGLSDNITPEGRALLRQIAARHGGVELPDGPHGRGNFMFPNRRAARQAGSEVAGDLSSDPSTFRASDYRGAPRGTNPNMVMGRNNSNPADPIDNHGTAGWRDDQWGHDFGKGGSVGPHVNAWNEGKGIENSHLYYQPHPNCP